MLVVLDANQLFSAMISGEKTLEVFINPKLELISPKFLIDEFIKHKEEIIRKSKLSEKELISFFILLTEKVKFFDIEEYKEFLSKAEEICPDKDDIEYFALAIKFNCPIWSNDKRLKEQNKIKVYYTHDLIKEL